MILSKQLIKQLIGLSQIASKDETRPHLMNIRLTKTEDNRLIGTATNGFTLLKVELPWQPLAEHMESDTAYISLDQLKVIKAALGKNEHAVMPYTDQVFNSDCTNYPNVDKIIPKRTSGTKVIVDLALLEQLSKSLRGIYGAGGTKVELTIEEPFDPIVVSKPNHIEACLVMPCREM